MSRKSRRKTLSHAEIENFLCDLGNDDETEVIKRNINEVVVPVSLSPSPSLSPSDENQREDFLSASSQDKQADEDRKYRAGVVRAFHKVSQAKSMMN